MSGSYFAVSDVVIALIGVISVAYLFMKWRYTYWERNGVPSQKPALFLGNVTRNVSFGEKLKALYHDIKSRGEKHAGMYFFLRPIYVPLDPELVKNIMQRDFQHFVDRGVYCNEADDPLSAHLFSLPGQKWKNLRAKLTPTFTSGKMKMMFPTVLDTSNQVTEILDKPKPDESVEIKDILARMTTDIIGSCAFGIDCNSLKDPDTDFRKHGKRVFEGTAMDQVRGFLSFMYPDLMKTLGLKRVPKVVNDFFMQLVSGTMKYREMNNVQRKDFMHLLIQLGKKGKVDDDDVVSAPKGKDEVALTFNEIVAQAFAFFLGGFETSSTTMSFCLYELALHGDIQQRLRDEISSVVEKHGGKLTYDALAEMRYMDMVLAETLRKYPPLSILFRLCVKDYDVPDTKFRLKKGTLLFIPIGGLHSDEEYFPKPEIFDPERFTEENKSKQRPYTYLPFGEGPRICIGLRFGLMQAKVGLSVLLTNYEFTLDPKTPVPLKMDPNSFMSSALGGIWLKVKKIQRQK